MIDVLRIHVEGVRDLDAKSICDLWLLIWSSICDLSYVCVSSQHVGHPRNATLKMITRRMQPNEWTVRRHVVPETKSNHQSLSWEKTRQQRISNTFLYALFVILGACQGQVQVRVHLRELIFLGHPGRWWTNHTQGALLRAGFLLWCQVKYSLDA